MAGGVGGGVAGAGVGTPTGGLVTTGGGGGGTVAGGGTYPKGEQPGMRLKLKLSGKSAAQRSAAFQTTK